MSLGEFKEYERHHFKIFKALSLDTLKILKETFIK